MTTYRVMPLPDGTDLRGSWQVKKGGRQISTHRKKSAAKRKAQRKAGEMDNVIVHRLNGTVQGSI